MRRAEVTSSRPVTRCSGMHLSAAQGYSARPRSICAQSCLRPLLERCSWSKQATSRQTSRVLAVNGSSRHPESDMHTRLGISCTRLCLVIRLLHDPAHQYRRRRPEILCLLFRCRSAPSPSDLGVVVYQKDVAQQLVLDTQRAFNLSTSATALPMLTQRSELCIHLLLPVAHLHRNDSTRPQTLYTSPNLSLPPSVSAQTGRARAASI